MKRNTIEIVKQKDGSEVWTVIKAKKAEFIPTKNGLVKLNTGGN